ncbi:hypothetical protein H7097_02215, partial [Aeromicrobium sp.]|nr:hypothetical protein [Candidatus Saccharibacteria bacterium]
FLADLRRGNAALTEAMLAAALDQFLAATQSILPKTATFTPSAVVPFGARQQLLVLIGSIEAEVMQAHAACLDELNTMLLSCGINHPAGFMRTSMNLRHALTFSPHISLLRQANPEPVVIDKDSLGVLQLQLADPEHDLRTS